MAATIVLAAATVEAGPGAPSRADGAGASTLEEAARRVEQRTGGRILSARVAGQRYVFRVLTPDGRVITSSVEAAEKDRR